MILITSSQTHSFLPRLSCKHCALKRKNISIYDDKLIPGFEYLPTVTMRHRSKVNWSVLTFTPNLVALLLDFTLITGLVLADKTGRKLKQGATWWNWLLNYSRCCSVIICFLSPLVAKAEITSICSKEGTLKLQNNAVTIKCNSDFQIIYYPDIKTSTNYFQLQLQQT